jgi:hypothetical protein
MKNLCVIPAIALLILVSGCASVVDVRHDYDPRFDFGGLETYNWLPVKAQPGANQLRINRFKSAVDEELEARGVELISDNPDFLIALHGFTQTVINVIDYGYQYGSRWSMQPRNLDVSTYEQGTVFLDFVDGESKELFWRGVAEGTLESDLSIEQQEEKFARIAAALIAEFPPKGD